MTEECSGGDGGTPKHQWEAGILEKKKGSSPTGRKKTPTYGTAHQPTTDDAVHPPPTHRSNLYYIQQCSSTYSGTPGTRRAVSWLVLEDLV